MSRLIVKLCDNSSLFLRHSQREMSTKAKTLNSKHVKEGYTLPAFSGLRLYNMRYSPFSHRTVLVLNAKEVDYEVININLVNRPKWIYNKNPRGKVPIMEIKKNVSIFESLITSEYVAEALPGRNLLAKDPFTRARDKIVIESSNMLTYFFLKTIRLPNEFDHDLAKQFYINMEAIQSELSSRGTKFLGGEQPGYVDYMIWPWFERLPVIENNREKLWPMPEKYARLTQYTADMRGDPAVSQYVVPDDIMREFLRGFTKGAPQYDKLDDMLWSALRLH